MPLVEPTELFVRSIGAVTDIVEKEMYTFTDLNGDSITLRPEGTASCVRAAMEHHLLYNGPQRLYYMGPMFRHEKPQKGRYRQFHQIGVEALGFPGPDVDAEHLVMCAQLWRRLGLQGIRLQINTLGSPEARMRYRERLVEYLERHLELLDEDSRRRLHTNPLRVLDSKNPAMQGVIECGAAAVRRSGRGVDAGISKSCKGYCAIWASTTRSIRDWCAGWTTTITRCSNGSASGSVRRLRYAPAAATMDCSRNSAASPHRPAGSPSGSSAFSALFAAEVPTKPQHARCISGTQRGRSHTHGLARRRADASGRRRCGISLRRRRLQVADEEGGCERRPLRGDHRGR